MERPREVIRKGCTTHLQGALLVVIAWGLVLLEAAPATAGDAPKDHPARCCDPCAEPPPPAPRELPCGSLFSSDPACWPVLYKSCRWSITASFEGGLAGIASTNSWFGNAPAIIGAGNDLTWIESYAEPGIDVSYALSRGRGSFYGRASWIADGSLGTDASGGTDRGRLGMEDYYVGWKSARRLGWLGGRTLDVSVGGREYGLGSGMLLWNGGVNGGTLADVWFSPRRAFEFTALVKLETDRDLIEAFYLVPHAAASDGTRTTLAGINYERDVGRRSTVGASFIGVLSSDRSSRSKLNLIDVRAQGRPFYGAPGLTLATELAYQFGQDRGAWGGFGEIVYTWCRSAWKPSVSYRVAGFSGDDPATTRNEAFDPLYYGNSDLEAWSQGIVLGTFVTVPSNLITHRIKLTVDPSDRLRIGMIAWWNLIDQPATFQPVSTSVLPTSDDLAWALDLYGQWRVNDCLSAELDLGLAIPNAGARQAFGAGDPWFVGVLSLVVDL